MKTPTLIVRLVGLYLLTTCTVGLLQLRQVKAMAGSFGTPSPMVGHFSIYLWLGVVAGLVATALAGPLARLLTFDADPREPSVDLSDRFLRK